MTTRLIADRLRSPPRRYTTRQDTSPGGTVTNVAILQTPNAFEQNSSLEQLVLHMREESRPDNTRKTQDPKVLEYFQFCDIEYPHDPYRHILSCGPVYRFMWFQCFREQRKKGGTKAQRVARAEGNFFEVEEYNEVMKEFNQGPAAILASRPMPRKPIGKCTFDAYKAVFRKNLQSPNCKKGVGNSMGPDMADGLGRAGITCEGEGAIDEEGHIR